MPIWFGDAKILESARRRVETPVVGVGNSPPPPPLTYRIVNGMDLASWVADDGNVVGACPILLSDCAPMDS